MLSLGYCTCCKKRKKTLFSRPDIVPNLPVVQCLVIHPQDSKLTSESSFVSKIEAAGYHGGGSHCDADKTLRHGMWENWMTTGDKITDCESSIIITNLPIIYGSESIDVREGCRRRKQVFLFPVRTEFLGSMLSCTSLAS